VLLLQRLYFWIRDDVFAIPGRAIAFLWVVGVLLLPLVLTESLAPMVMRVVIVGSLYAIFAFSWDLLAGFTGQVSLGHALFFGTGAYAAAILNLRLGWPVWATIPAGALFSVVAGLITCLPALRLRGMYLALVTLALPLILTGVIYVWKDFTGGEYGLGGVATLGMPQVATFYIIFLLMVAMALIAWKLTDTRSKIVRTGVILRAILEDEIAARMSGIMTTRYKVVVFAVSGLMSGLAGVLYAHYFRVVGPSTLELMLSFNALVWTVFGGIGTIYGPIAGVFVLYPLVELTPLAGLGHYRFVIQALILVIVLLFMPQGITTWVRDHIEEFCPRCKLINSTWRTSCRACGAPLHPERERGAGHGK